MTAERQFMFMIHGVVDDDGTVTLGIEAEPYFHSDEDVWNATTEEWERMRDQPDAVWDRYGRAAQAVDVAVRTYNDLPAAARRPGE